jgi:excisionase family DNA binding protein
VPEIISIREVCDRYGLSDKTVRRKIKAGELPAYRVGERLYKLDAGQVEAALLQPANHQADIAAAVDRVLAAWPALTDEQLDRIAALLRVGDSAADRQAAVQARLAELDGGGDNAA